MHVVLDTLICSFTWLFPSETLGDAPRDKPWAGPRVSDHESQRDTAQLSGGAGFQVSVDV